MKFIGSGLWALASVILYGIEMHHGIKSGDNPMWFMVVALGIAVMGSHGQKRD